MPKEVIVLVPPRQQRLRAAAEGIAPQNLGSSAESSDIDPGSKAVVQQLFGEELGDAMALAAGYGKRKDYRTVLEPTDAVAQCVRAGVPFTDGMECYLCGLPIPPKATLAGKADELYVECEHILPVTEARWYLDLYMANRRPEDPWTTKAVQLEYAQAHRVCNQAKTNMSFVSADPDGNPVVNDGKIKTILLAIQKRAREDLKNNYGATKHANANLMRHIANFNIPARIAAIRPRVEEIVKHASTNPLSSALTVLARTAMLVDPAPLPEAVRAEYLQSTELDREQIEAEAARRLAEFRAKALEEYPQFLPDILRDSMLRLEPGLATLPPADYDDILSPAGVNRVLDAYYAEAYTLALTDQPRVVETVYFGLFRMLFDRLVTRSPSPTVLLCGLHARMTDISAINKVAVTALGPVPEMSGELRSRCSALATAGRAARRGAPDEAESPPEVEQTIAYALGNRFEALLAEQLQGIVEDPTEHAFGIATLARTAFRDAVANGQSDEEALEDAIREVSGQITLIYFNAPDEAARIVAILRHAIEAARPGEEPSDTPPPEPMDESETIGPAGAGSGGPPRSGGKRKTRRPLYG